MVKIFVLSEYSTSPPKVLGGGRIKIDGGPLYDLARMQALAKNEACLNAVTEKCRKDIANLFDSDLERVGMLIGCLKKGNYIDSEWCENGRAGVMACDAYRIRRVEEMPATGKQMEVEYYLKLAVGKTGTLVLMASCHI